LHQPAHGEPLLASDRPPKHSLFAAGKDGNWAVCPVAAAETDRDRVVGDHMVENCGRGLV